MSAPYARMADLCQHVFAPGSPDMLTAPACLPYLVVPDGESLRAHYRCADCGRQWKCWWSKDHLDMSGSEDAA